MSYHEFYQLSYNSIVQDKHKTLYLVREKYCATLELKVYHPETQEYIELHYSELKLFKL